MLSGTTTGTNTQQHKETLCESTMRIAAVALVYAFLTVCHAQAVCPARSDPCMNDTNWKQCQTLQASGCQRIITRESCPLQFSCAAQTPFFPVATPKAPTRAPKVPVSAPIKLPEGIDCSVHNRPNDICSDKRNYRRCKNLVRRGCREYQFAKSCPPQDFRCTNPFLLPLLPRPWLIPRSTILRCPTLDEDSCLTTTNRPQCEELVARGCQNVVALDSCPYRGFRCGDDDP